MAISTIAQANKIGMLISATGTYTTLQSLVDEIKAKATNEQIICRAPGALMQALVSGSSNNTGVCIAQKLNATTAMYIAFNKSNAGLGSINLSTGAIADSVVIK